MEKDMLNMFYKNVGKKIKRIRIEKELKAFDIAQRLGIAESTYTKIERGETKVGIDKIQELASIYELPFEYFLITPDHDEYYHFEHSPNSGKITTQHIQIDRDLLEALKLQLREKDKQIAQLLLKIK